MDTPILFLIFNRPDLTKVVFDRIKQIKPRQLFVAADGARHIVNGEKDKCAAAREVVMQHIDWPCEVRTLFRTENLGCKNAVSSAINWFFEHVEDGIILEDDCLPDLTFFNFCSILLAHYRDDPRVMHIGGNNFVSDIYEVSDSYYFSKLNHIWGWATWRSAWQQYDVELQAYSDIVVRRTFPGLRTVQDYWIDKFKKVKNREIDTWDYQWTYTLWKNNALAIVPKSNLVINLGFRKDATHTTEVSTFIKNMGTTPIVEVKHPKKIKLLKKADSLVSEKLFRIKPNVGFKNKTVSWLMYRLSKLKLK